MRTVLFRNVTARFVALLLCESALIVGAVFAGAFIRLNERQFERFEGDAHKVLLIAAVTQLWLYFSDLYDFRVINDRRELFVRSMQALGATSLTLAALYFWFPDLMIGRGVAMLSAFFVIVFIFGWRVMYEWAGRTVGPRERLLLVGTGEGAIRLARELYRRKELGVEIAGFIDPDPAMIGTPVLNPGVIGSIDDIPAIIREKRIDQVVVSLSDARGKLPMDKLLEMKLEGVTFSHLATVYEAYTGKIAVENLRPSWLIFQEGFRKSALQRVCKRSMDIALAGIGLVLTSPLMLLVAAAVKLTSAGPALYHQGRVGLRNNVFVLHKFRSMRVDAERDTGAVWARPADSRVTPIGAFLRRSRLDELPQLWNILRGDMSLVGPRPERPEFVSKLGQDIPFYGQRHTVRPGLTGWAQVQYTYGASAEDALEKLQYDLFYIKHMSLALDLFIIVKTVKTVLMRRGGR